MTLKRPEEFDHFTAALPDLDVHYVRQGSGPILMLWHGWPGSGGTGASLWASMCRTSGGTGQLTQTVRCGIWRFDVKGARPSGAGRAACSLRAIPSAVVLLAPPAQHG